MSNDTLTPSNHLITWTRIHSGALFSILLSVVLIEFVLPPSLRLWTWLSILFLLGLFALIAGHGVTGLWLGLFIDTRNKVSLSRLQMTLWTVLILSGFLAAALANLDAAHDRPLEIMVPAELWLLMGISTTSLVGSPLIVHAKKQRRASEEEKSRALALLTRQSIDVSQVSIEGRMVMNEIPEAARWSDLFRGSETSNAWQLDLGKLQMFFFTVILVLAYGASLGTLFASDIPIIRALPALDTGMIALLGISHAGYLVNKAFPAGDG